MKKVIVLILFTFLLIPLYKVKAINSFELPINQNIKINSVTKKYKWYKEEKVDSRLDNVFEHICEYLELKETDFSDWLEEKPEEKYGRIIEEKTVNESFEMKPYNDVIIDNIHAQNLHIKEIYFYDEYGKEIEYYYATCENCDSYDDSKYFYDRDYSTTYDFKYGTYFYFKLKTDSISNLRAQIIFEHDDLLFGFRVSVYKNGNFLYSKEENRNTLFRVYSPAYDSYINSSSLSFISQNSKTLYRYKDAYLICSEKIYLDDYYENIEGYIKDESNYITYYDYENSKELVKEKQVFKEIIVPEEKIIYEYISDSCEYEKVDNTIEIENITNKSKDFKRNAKFIVIFLFILFLIFILCLFLKELIKKCR